MKPVDPVAMARLALSPHLNVPRNIPVFGLSSRRNKSKAEMDIVGVLSSCERGDRERAGKLEQGHPFLKYASTHWISHTSRFRKVSTTWDLWHRMITCRHDLAKRPWPEQQDFNALDSDLLAWSLQSRHYALVRLIEGCGGISEPEKCQSMWSLAGQGDIELLDVLLEGNYSLQITAATLQAASGAGHFEVVERLLATGKVDVNAKDNFGQTPLSRAAGNGHKAVVRLLRSVK